jgi:hypothetical protein
MRGTKQQRHYSLTILHIFGVLQSGRLCGNTKKTQILTSHRYKLTFSIAKFYPIFLFLIYSSSQSSSRHISLILYIYEMKCAGYTNLDHQNRRNTGAQGCLAGVARAVLRTAIADLQTPGPVWTPLSSVAVMCWRLSSHPYALGSNDGAYLVLTALNRS